MVSGYNFNSDILYLLGVEWHFMCVVAISISSFVASIQVFWHFSQLDVFLVTVDL